MDEGRGRMDWRFWTAARRSGWADILLLRLVLMLKSCGLKAEFRSEVRRARDVYFIAWQTSDGNLREWCRSHVLV